MNKKSTLRSVANDYLTHPKSKSGITLVALIITIIVLLILAMVSIRLVMNGGIIDKSKNAVDKYSNEEIMEQIKLAYQEYQMSQYTDNPLTLQQAMDKAFGEGVATVSGDATNGYKVKVKGIVYPLSANGTVEEGVEEGKVKYGDQILGVGDYVNYDPTLNPTGDITYTSLASNSGKTGENADQVFDAAKYKAAGYGWRVLDVKNGQIRLISESYVGPGDYGTSNLTQYELRGQAGYINGIEELKKISAIYGKGKGAASATSITVEDINGITGYNPATAKYGEGQWYEYGNKVTYIRGSGNALSSSATNGQSWSGTQSTFKYYNGTEFVDLAGSTTVISTPYTYGPATLRDGFTAPTQGVDQNGVYNEVNTMLFGNYNTGSSSNGYYRSFTGTGIDQRYWLASDCAIASDGNADWGLRIVHGGGVAYYDLYHSYGYEGRGGGGVRPVVSLKSSVNLKWNATGNQWEIQ